MSLTDVTDWSAQCDLIYLYIYSVKETVQYVTWLNKIRGMYSLQTTTVLTTQGRFHLILFNHIGQTEELTETFHNNVNVLTMYDVSEDELNDRMAN